MSHDHVCVKAEGSVDTDLGVVTTEEGGQPATLSSVHQQEHHVMVLDQLLQSLHLLGHLVYRLLCEGVCVCVCVCEGVCVWVCVCVSVCVCVCEEFIDPILPYALFLWSVRALEC